MGLVRRCLVWVGWGAVARGLWMWFLLFQSVEFSVTDHDYIICQSAHFWVLPEGFSSCLGTARDSHCSNGRCFNFPTTRECPWKKLDLDALRLVRSSWYWPG